jgi:hypothetical protein
MQAHTPPFTTVGTTANDEVNHPAHYNFGEIEAIAYLKDNLGDGYRYKGKALQDLKKAQWYLNQLIDQYEGV